jgi:hypothetical protein
MGGMRKAREIILSRGWDGMFTITGETATYLSAIRCDAYQLRQLATQISKILASGEQQPLPPKDSLPDHVMSARYRAARASTRGK